MINDPSKTGISTLGMPTFFLEMEHYIQAKKITHICETYETMLKGLAIDHGEEWKREYNYFSMKNGKRIHLLQHNLMPLILLLFKQNTKHKNQNLKKNSPPRIWQYRKIIKHRLLVYLLQVLTSVIHK